MSVLAPTKWWLAVVISISLASDLLILAMMYKVILKCNPRNYQENRSG
jgi:hypothetical protein